MSYKESKSCECKERYRNNGDKDKDLQFSVLFLDNIVFCAENVEEKLVLQPVRLLEAAAARAVRRAEYKCRDFNTEYTSIQKYI